MTSAFLSIDDISRAELIHLFDLAILIKKEPKKYAQYLQGKHWAMVFEKPSLRTRASFEVGIEKLGGNVHFYDLQNEKIGVRESTADFGKNLEQWYDGVIARVDSHDTLTSMTEAISIPLINALCDQHHPCQALADFLTLYELDSRLDSWHLAYFGDHNNVSRSLADLAYKLDVRMTVVSPSISNEQSDYLSSLQSLSNSKIQWTDSIESLKDVNVVYTDVWSSMGSKPLDSLEMDAFKPYQINDELMVSLNCHYFMHCQPVHRGEEASSSVCDSDGSLMFHQAKNRMLAQQALLLMMTSGV